MKLRKLPRSFFARDTHQVARELLGTLLVRTAGAQQLIGRVVEVESYVGVDDLACHAARGRTPRTEVMFGEAGRAYVYLIYGMYHCLNVVTEQPEFPAAVLIRALAPVAGIPTMQKRRRQQSLTALTSGPGKLTQAFAITKTLTGEDMTTSAQLYFADDGTTVSPSRLSQSPRIGVDYAGACAAWEWRYFIRDNPYVSKRR